MRAPNGASRSSHQANLFRVPLRHILDTPMRAAIAEQASRPSSRHQQRINFHPAHEPNSCVDRIVRFPTWPVHRPSLDAPWGPWRLETPLVRKRLYLQAQAIAA